MTRNSSRALAGDLNAQVAGVWFDQSTIQLGQKWHDEIMEGIRECKAFILVLSPDAAEFKYVREEVNKALELGKTIFPILYRPGKWTGEFELLVKEVQTLDLRSGSYTDNFQKLVDGLIEAGAVESNFRRKTISSPGNTNQYECGAQQNPWLGICLESGLDGLLAGRNCVSRFSGQQPGGHGQR